jgi:predicted  nucleic acid-binding Zn-ribbon protein
MDMMTIAEELARQSEQIKSLSDRMGNLEKLTESVNKLAISLERLTARESATEKQVEHLAEDMEGIKGKPAKHWETAIAAVISAIVGAGIALLIK